MSPEGISSVLDFWFDELEPRQWWVGMVRLMR